MEEKFIKNLKSQCLTNGNYCGCYPHPRVPQSRSRHFVPLCGFAPPHFAVAGLCYAKPFYATAKCQLPVTLSAIPPKKSQKNIIDNYIMNIKMS